MFTTQCSGTEKDHVSYIYIVLRSHDQKCEITNYWLLCQQSNSYRVLRKTKQDRLQLNNWDVFLNKASNSVHEFVVRTLQTRSLQWKQFGKKGIPCAHILTGESNYFIHKENLLSLQGIYLQSRSFPARPQFYGIAV